MFRSSRSRTALLVTGLGLAWCGAGLAQAPGGLPKNLDTDVTRAMTLFETPGVAVAVVKDGKVVMARGYGVRKIGEVAPVDADTRFQIASNTKAFTTALISMLADSGKLSWDDPVQQYLPYFQLYDPWVTREFTIRDLVTHRSGLGLGAGDLLWFHSNYTRAEISRRIRAAKPVTSFRSAYAYDNVLYIVAGEVIGAVTGKPWDDVVRERIFQPLGMRGATTTVTTVQPGDNVASPHAVVNGQIVVVPVDTADNIASAGGINAGVNDMARWVIAQLDSGRANGQQLYSTRMAREMWSGQTIKPITDQPAVLAPLQPQFFEYGLGWNLRDYRGRKIVYHTGGLAGMTSQVTLVPSERLGIIVLTNGEQPLFQALTFRILDSYFGAPPADWIGVYAALERQSQTAAGQMVQRAQAQRDSLSHPSLPLAGYAGAYSESLYGGATITQEGDGLVLRFDRSPAFVGDLVHWQYDTFVARWRTAHLEDAFVTFTLKPDGSIASFAMQAVSPLADFSFDYQDLFFRPSGK